MKRKRVMWVRWSKKDGCWWIRGCWCAFSRENDCHRFAIKQYAVREAVAVAQLPGAPPIELRICGKNGRIQEARTYPRSADPRRSAG